jgi:hypothetical protein
MFDISRPESCIIDSICAASDTSYDTDKPTVSKIIYDRKSAAFALSISTRALDYLIQNKVLNTIKWGSKVMVSHAELVKLSKKNLASLCSVEEAD